MYAARPILISGDCKREDGQQHAKLIDTTLLGVESLRADAKIRVTSIASDGETRRGAAFVQKTFKKQLSEDSPIYDKLEPLKFLDLHVGDDDLTCDKDWKHVFKRFRNLLLRQKGIVVNRVRITPDITKDHLRQASVSADHIRAIFNPNDKQDVKLAFDMLQAIWSLPEAPAGKSPGFLAARNALRLLGRFLYHMVFPYLCVDLTLSEQVEHLSSAAHLAFALYLKDGTNFIPNNLFIDFNIMVKNVIFTIAKAQTDIPESELHIMLLGTDRLEELFGILRTMIGNDANLDILQLACRLASTTEVSNILAEFTQWDKGLRRLKLLVLTRESTELHRRADHIKPATWRGDVHVKNVSLQTSWNRGRLSVEVEYPFVKDMLAALEEKDNVTMLAPRGVLLFDVPGNNDDADDSLDEDAQTTAEVPATTAGTNTADSRIEVEDAVVEAAAVSDNAHVLIKGVSLLKSRALASYSKYRIAAPNSTDRLRRVQDVPRYAREPGELNELDLPEGDGLMALEQANTDILAVSDSIASLLSCESKVWLSIGEVNGLRVDGKAVDFVDMMMLSESIVTVSYQLLGLRRATSDEDPSEQYDWRTYRTLTERSFTVPGSLISPINPEISKTHSDIPWYMLDSAFLVSVAASLSQSVDSEGSGHGIPKIARGADFPYLEQKG